MFKKKQCLWVFALHAPLDQRNSKVIDTEHFTRYYLMPGTMKDIALYASVRWTVGL